MFLEQVACAKSSLAYLFGCAGLGLAIAVDVHAGDEAAFITMAEARGVRIRYVIDTHIHADHVSGGRRLAQLAGGEYGLHECNQGLPFEFLPLGDGQILRVGNVAAQVIHTPGHTDDSLCLAVTDHSRGDAPWFMLTGHTLFVGGVGRLDLHGRATEMAGKLHDSIFGRILSQPDYLEILPGAQVGSVCGGGISGKPCSTIGFEKKFNRSLIGKREDFVAQVCDTVLPEVEEMQIIVRDGRRFAVYLGAIGVAILATLAVQAWTSVDLNQTKTPYRTPDFAWGQYILGGLIFGVGMVLARGCPVRSLVKFTQGNMQALVAVIVMALSAYAMTRTELFSVAFAPWVGMLSVNLTHWGIAHQDLASILGGGTLTYRIMAVVIAAGLLFAAWRWLPLRKNRVGWLGAVLIGSVVGSRRCRPRLCPQGATRIPLLRRINTPPVALRVPH